MTGGNIEVDEIRRRASIVAYKVAHQRVNDVCIEEDALVRHSNSYYSKHYLLDIAGVPRDDRRMITSIKFVTIPVADQDRALRYYTEVLGFAVNTDQPMGGAQRWIELRLGKSETAVALFTPEGYEQRVGTYTGLSMQCDDVARTFEDLSARGAIFERPPQQEAWGTSAILKDSEGNTIVLSSK